MEKQLIYLITMQADLNTKCHQQRQTEDAPQLLRICSVSAPYDRTRR